MIDEAKKVVDALRCDIECDSYMLKRCAAYKLEKDAADLIERLSEELEQVNSQMDVLVAKAVNFDTLLEESVKMQVELEQIKRERDAAVYDLLFMDGCCDTCRKNGKECTTVTERCIGYEWRGIVSENRGSDDNEN